jgi:hypothetical protein
MNEHPAYLQLFSKDAQSLVEKYDDHEFCFIVLFIIVHKKLNSYESKKVFYISFLFIFERRKRKENIVVQDIGK